MQRTLEPEGNPEHRGQPIREIGKHWTVQQNSASSHRPSARGTFFVPARQFDPNEPELMDRPGVNKAWLRQELETLQKLNRLGGHRLMLHYVSQLASQYKLQELSVLDLATGAADIPRAIVAWA